MFTQTLHGKGLSVHIYIYIYATFEDRNFMGFFNVKMHYRQYFTIVAQFYQCNMCELNTVKVLFKYKSDSLVSINITHVSDICRLQKLF